MRTNRQGLKLVSHDGQILGSNQDQAGPITEEDYRILTAWRDTLRGFMSASKAILKQANVTPNQYQALLAIRFGNQQAQLTVGELAANLHIRHNSAVALINKLVGRGTVRRMSSHQD
ncbi:MAG: MarR family transcriptional regulator, partial [Gammaproteobacteria bacterium]